MTIQARALSEPWRVEYSADTVTGVADTLKNGMGGHAGFRPHELLKAAVAACMTITARMCLADRKLDDRGVTVTVDLIRDDDTSRFQYVLELPARLESERQMLMERLEHSPVRTTLSKNLTFEPRWHFVTSES